MYKNPLDDRDWDNVPDREEPMKRREQRPRSCTTIRVIHVRTGILDPNVGFPVKYTSEHDEIGPCNTPLFSDDTVCSACAEGWQVEGNRPATDDEKKEHGFS